MSSDTTVSKTNTTAVAVGLWHKFNTLSPNARGFVLVFLGVLSLGIAMFLNGYLPHPVQPHMTKTEEILYYISMGAFFASIFFTMVGCLYITPFWLKTVKGAVNDEST